MMYILSIWDLTKTIYKTSVKQNRKKNMKTEKRKKKKKEKNKEKFKREFHDVLRAKSEISKIKLTFCSNWMTCLIKINGF